MPSISVVMSVYNEPLSWISLSINSILDQTFGDFEFIIVNDNPESLEHKELLRNYAEHDSRIILIENERNFGLTKSLNIGIVEASGKYVVRMDADDISLPNRFQVQFDYMESHHEVDVCGSFAKVFGNVPKFSSRRLIVPESYEQIKLTAFVHTPMIHPSVMFRMERLPNKLYNEDFKKAQDYVLWGSLIKQGFILYNIPEYLIKYRVTIKSNNSNYRSQQFAAADHVRANLIKQLMPEINNNTIELHNRICNEQNCDLKEAEKWLQMFKSILSSSTSSDFNYISALISRLWININLTNSNSLKKYCKSHLTESVSFFNTLRFIKRDLLICTLLKKLMGGG